MTVSRELALERSALLADGVRRALHDFVSRADRPVDRDTAAAATGISRSLAAFHLDRLARSGLLEIEFQHRGERRGPGAGRPAKFYRRPTGQPIDLSVPPRRYERAGKLLAQAIDDGPNETPLMDRVTVAARSAGTDVGARAARAGAAAVGLVETLRNEGYEPVEQDDTVLLRNCPFDALVDDHRPLICGMNLAFLEGVADALPGAGLTPQRDVRPGYCCVSLKRSE